MAIRGELLSADLSNVFQMLALNRKRGRLVVQETGNFLAQRRLYLAEDRVALDEPPRERPLSALLVEMGVLTYEQYEAAAAKSDRFRSDPLALLRQQGEVTAQQIEDVRRRLEEEEILEVFLWRNVTFTLDEVPAWREAAPYFSVDHLVMEAARRQDEWRHVMGDGAASRQIFVRTGASAETGHLPIERVPRIVLEHVDGVRGSLQIMEATGLPRYHVDLGLRHLQAAGLVSVMDLADLISTGDSLAAQGRVDDALRLFRSALQYDRRSLTLHRRLGSAWLQLGSIAKAAAHYRFCAAMLVQLGRRREAIGVLANVLKILPTDFLTLKHCAELIAEEGRVDGEDEEEIVAGARRLFAFYVDSGQDGAAHALAERLLVLKRDDEELLGSVARLSLRLGQPARAAQAYEHLAELRCARDDVSGALEIYRTLAGVDPTNRHVYDIRSTALNNIRELRRRRRRRIRTLITGGILVVVLGAGALVYIELAARALARVPAPDVSTAALADASARRFEQVAKRFPFTRAAGEAAARARELDGVAAQLGHKQLQEREIAVQQRRDTEERARGLFEKGRTLTVSDLPGAAAAYADALEVAQTLGGKWPLEEQVREALADVRRYREEGAALAAKARDALARGQREEAFGVIREIVARYELIPEKSALSVPVRIAAAPRGTRITVVETGVSGPSPLDTELPLSGKHVVLRLEAPGAAPSDMEFAVPPPGFETALVLDTPPAATHALGIPVAGAVALDGGQAALVARNGQIVFLDPATGRTTVRAPNAITTVRVAPVAAGSGVITVSDYGEVRRTDPDASRPRFRVTPFEKADRPLPPIVRGDAVLVAFESGDAALLSVSDGAKRWSVNLGRKARALSWCGDGIAVLDERGAVALVDPASGTTLRVFDGPFEGPLSTDAQDRLLACRKGRGLVRVGGEIEPVFAAADGSIAGAVRAAGGIAVSAGDRRIVFVAPGRWREISLPEEVRSIAAAPAERIIVGLASGRFVVLDASTGTPIAGAAPVPDGLAVTCGERLVLSDGAGAVRVIPLP